MVTMSQRVRLQREDEGTPFMGIVEVGRDEGCDVGGVGSGDDPQRRRPGSEPNATQRGRLQERETC